MFGQTAWGFLAGKLHLPGGKTMTYEAPKITEAGRFADVTLGRNGNGHGNGHGNGNPWDHTPGSR